MLAVGWGQELIEEEGEWGEKEAQSQSLYTMLARENYLSHKTQHI